MSNIEWKISKNEPSLSSINLNESYRIDVEVLKHFNYEAVINSARLRISEYRGQEIVETIFNALSDEFDDICDEFDIFNDSLGRNNKKGSNLLPPDFKKLYDGFTIAADKKRVVCDFIAGMTDRYAMEFYGRLKSENPQTIFKPL